MKSAGGEKGAEATGLPLGHACVGKEIKLAHGKVILPRPGQFPISKSRGYPKIPRELRCESHLACSEARGGRVPSAVSDRRATKEQAKWAATPLGPGSFGLLAASLARHVARWLCSSLDSLPSGQNPPGAATGNFWIASNDAPTRPRLPRHQRHRVRAGHDGSCLRSVP